MKSLLQIKAAGAFAGHLPQSADKVPNLPEKQTCNAPAGQPRSHRTALYLFLVCFTIFDLSPVAMLLDTRFELLTSESLLRHRSVALNRFKIPGLDPRSLPLHPDLEADRSFYQLVRVGGKTVYRYPHGGALLALPFVAGLDLAGISVVRGDGSYDAVAEIRLGRLLASMLMAVLVALFFEIAAGLVPAAFALAIAMAAGFGSQIWSNTSRALWSQTWEIFIAGWIIWLLLAAEEQCPGHRPEARPAGAPGHPFVLAVLCASHRHDRGGERYTVCMVASPARLSRLSALWSGMGRRLRPVFPVGLRSVDSRLLSLGWPNWRRRPDGDDAAGVYYKPVARATCVHTLGGRDAVSGNAPLARPFSSRVGALSLTIIAGYVAAVCAFSKWWGGWSYGPRLLSSLIPWWVLLAALGFQALLRYCARPQANHTPSVYRRAMVTCGVLTALIGIIINGWGAISWAPFLWNRAVQIDQHPERIWDWHRPQFTAGWTDLARQNK